MKKPQAGWVPVCGYLKIILFTLDSASSKEILQILKSMHEQGKTVILITHDNGIAAQARRVVRIMDGKIESDFINKNYGKEEYIKNQLDA